MDNMIWFKQGGSIEGMEVEELNQYITEYNRTGCWKFGEFIGWLNWKLGTDFDGFSALGNAKNAAMNRLIPVHKFEPVEIDTGFCF